VGAHSSVSQQQLSADEHCANTEHPERVERSRVGFRVDSEPAEQRCGRE
jgi:hypothetical protein